MNITLNDLNLRQDYVLIAPADKDKQIIDGSVFTATKHSSGLYISEANEKSDKFQVLKVGSGVKNTKVGDVVIVTNVWNNDLNYEIMVDGINCFIWREADMLCKLEHISLEN